MLSILKKKHGQRQMPVYARKKLVVESTNPNKFFISCKESRIESNTSFYGCFYLGPFDESFSQTLANDLRRTLLSESRGLAITSVQIEGVLHKFSNLPGMKETVLDMLLNLQTVVLKNALSEFSRRFSARTPLSMGKEEASSNIISNTLAGSFKFETNQNFLKTYNGFLKVRGPRVIKALDLKLPAGIQVVDPNQYICTLAENSILNMKFTINEGKNYILQKPQKINSLSRKKKNILLYKTKKSDSPPKRNAPNIGGNSRRLPCTPVGVNALLPPPFVPSLRGKAREREKSAFSSFALSGERRVAKVTSIYNTSQPALPLLPSPRPAGGKTHFEKTADLHLDAVFMPVTKVNCIIEENILATDTDSFKKENALSSLVPFNFGLVDSNLYYSFPSINSLLLKPLSFSLTLATGETSKAKAQRYSQVTAAKKIKNDSANAKAGIIKNSDMRFAREGTQLVNASIYPLSRVYEGKQKPLAGHSSPGWLPPILGGYDMVKYKQVTLAKSLYRQKKLGEKVQRHYLAKTGKESDFSLVFFNVVSPTVRFTFPRDLFPHSVGVISPEGKKTKGGASTGEAPRSAPQGEGSKSEAKNGFDLLKLQPFTSSLTNDWNLAEIKTLACSFGFFNYGSFISLKGSKLLLPVPPKRQKRGKARERRAPNHPILGSKTPYGALRGKSPLKPKRYYYPYLEMQAFKSKSPKREFPTPYGALRGKSSVGVIFPSTPGCLVSNEKKAQQLQSYFSSIQEVIPRNLLYKVHLFNSNPLRGTFRAMPVLAPPFVPRSRGKVKRSAGWVNAQGKSKVGVIFPTEKKGKIAPTLGTETISKIRDSRSAFALRANVKNLDYSFLELSKVLKLKPVEKKHHLILEIWTNGSLHPRQALYNSLSFLSHTFIRLQNVRIPGSMFLSELAYGNINKSYTHTFATPSLPFAKSAPPNIEGTYRVRGLSSNKVEKSFYGKRSFDSYNAPIGVLSISLLTYTGLRKIGILTLADLLRYSKTSLLKAAVLSSKSLYEIEKSLMDIGLILKN